jgi:precorrin-8X/cobalt-precorrin-8 methylmutase
MISYLREPAAITRESFATIRREARLDRLDADMVPLALRIAHASGMVDAIDDLAWSHGATAAGRVALRTGAPILCDARMVAAGITRNRLPANNAVICTLDDVSPAPGTTRSAAAVALWRPHLAGAIVAIGNAPTALFRLLEELDAGAPRPALILGFPVGFVGAAESKAELAHDPRGAAFIVLHGRRGGSAMAAASVNALALDPAESGA